MATDRDLRLAANWLRANGLDLPPTPLLAARLALRRQASRGLLVIMLLAVLTVIAQLGGWLPTSPGLLSPSQAAITVLLLAAVVVRALGMRWVARGERRLGATLTARAAHAARPGWRATIGIRHLSSGVVLYSGSVALAVAALAFGRSTEAKTMAGVLLVAIAAFFTLTFVGIAGIMRRPALAEDQASLVVDDVLRTMDVRASATPLLPALLASTTVSQGGGQYPAWLLLCAIALSLLVIVAITWSATEQRSAAAVTPTSAPGA